MDNLTFQMSVYSESPTLNTVPGGYTLLSQSTTLFTIHLNMFILQGALHHREPEHCTWRPHPAEPAPDTTIHLNLFVFSEPYTTENLNTVPGGYTLLGQPTTLFTIDFENKAEVKIV